MALQAHALPLLTRALRALAAAHGEAAAARALKARDDLGGGGGGDVSVLEHVLELCAMNTGDTGLLLQASALLRAAGQRLPPTLSRHLPMQSHPEGTPMTDRLIASAEMLA